MGKYEGDPLVQRWAGFIEKITGRLAEIEAESAEGLAGLMEQAPDDYMSFSNAFSGLDARIHQLRKKIDETWEEQVEPKFSDANDSKRGILDVGIDMMKDAEMALEHRWWLFKCDQAVKFFENLEPLAKAKLAEPTPCSQCGRPLENPDPMVAQSIRCAACNAVNQVAPDPIVVAYGGAPAAYADKASTPLRIEIEKWREQVDRNQRDKRQRDDYSNAGIEYLEQWERMERAFWMKHAEVFAERARKPVDTALVQSRMKSFFQYSLESEQIWVKKYGKKSQQM